MPYHLRWTITFAYLFLFNLTQAQNTELDSMIKHLEKGELIDTARIQLATKIAYHLKDVNITLGLTYIDRAIEYANQYKHSDLMHTAYCVKAYLLTYNKSYKEGFEYYYKAIEYAKSTKYFDLLARCYGDIGQILLRNKSYKLAEQYSIKSFENYSLAKNEDGQYYSTRMLANVAFRQGKYEDAIMHFKSSLNYRNIKRNYGAFNDLGLCYKNLNRLDEALTYYQQAYELAAKEKPGFASLVLGNMGEIYLLQKNFPKAIEYLNYDLTTNRNNTWEYSSIVNTYTQLAECHANLNRIDIAINYVDSAIHITEISPIVKSEYKLKALEKKARLLILQKNFQYASKVLTDFIQQTYIDKQENENISAVESQIISELNSVEREVDLLKKEIELEEQVRYTYVTMLILLIIGIIVILYYFSKLKKASKTIAKQMSIANLQKAELDRGKTAIEVSHAALQQANKKLTEMNEEKNEFLRLVAHDLKNPLSRVMGLTQLIEMNPNGFVNDETEKLNYIKQSVNEMNLLINHFLDVNQIESSEQQVEKENVLIPELIEEETAKFNIQAAEKNIALNIQVDKSTITSYTDERILRIIYSNILSNAIKFGLHHMPVSISIHDEINEVQVVIKDSGPGLTEKDKQGLFKKYTRLSARPTGNETSTGLGLYLVKLMADKASIRITYTSELGKGTEMIIHIPKTK